LRQVYCTAHGLRKILTKCIKGLIIQVLFFVLGGRVVGVHSVASVASGANECCQFASNLELEVHKACNIIAVLEKYVKPTHLLMRTTL